MKLKWVVRAETPPRHITPHARAGVVWVTGMGAWDRLLGNVDPARAKKYNTKAEAEAAAALVPVRWYRATGKVRARRARRPRAAMARPGV